MTRKQAKNILAKHGFENPFTLKTIGFQDLARAEAQELVIKNWHPGPLAAAVLGSVKAHNQETGDRVIVGFSGAGLVA